MSTSSLVFIKTSPTVEDEGEADKEMPDSECSFSDRFLAELLNLSEARDKAVRFRVCQVVSKLLGYITEMKRVVDTELLESTQEVMLTRAFDKVRKIQ